ncbi:MAG: DUF4760 domain-containing protein [Janthinobacterium lividum]
MYQEILNVQNELAPSPPEGVLLKDYIGFLVQIVSVAVAAFALFKTLKEYRKQGLEKRAQQYLEIRKGYRENELFQKIVIQAHGDQDFTAFATQQRVEYMAFFEDMQFLINSGLIKSDIVYYMFGSDIIRAWNGNFCILWDTENNKENDIRNDPNFTLLKRFVEGAKEFKTSGEIAKRIEKSEL